MSFFAMVIFFMYVTSLFTPLNKVTENQEKVRKQLKELEDSDLPSKLGLNLMKGIGLSIIFLYIVFYIAAASILNQTFFTLASALFIVLSVRTTIKLFNMLNGKLTIQPRWTQKLYPIAGVFYTVYFIMQYYQMQADNAAQVILGTVIAIIVFVLAKNNSAKKRKKEEAKGETS
jgi:hypothetical protein